MTNISGSDMQLIIPMSGQGSRFVEAGYDDVKPLINVFGRPMIEWVLHAFPESDVTFICRDEHLQFTPMESVLRKLRPSARIISVQGHKKGPVFALSSAFDQLDESRPVLVSYCDYYMRWDYSAFKQAVAENQCDGAVPCYSGFHPHLIPQHNLYASCRTDDNDYLLEIREKYSFASDKSQALHSPGVYYFRTGALMRQYCQKLLDEGPALNGEYYNSLVYNHMVEDQLRVWVPNSVDYFCQWGTPYDLQECEYWVGIVRGMGK